MKRLLLAMCAILLGVVSLLAQDDLYKELGKKYDKMEGYQVVSVGRAAIRMAAMSGDKESREMMRKIDLLVSVSRKGEVCGPLRSDFDRLVNGYNSVGTLCRDTAEVVLFMNPEHTGFAMYSHTPSGETVLLLQGKDLKLEELLPKDVQLD
jgi:hypothetical protein